MRASSTQSMTDEAGMRHGLAVDRIDGMVLLLVHLVATAALAGLVCDAAARRLVRTSWWRTAAWTAGTACAAVLVARGG